MTDPITDMLNQIKNAEAVAKTEVLIPLSKIKNEIANILFKEGFIGETKKATIFFMSSPCPFPIVRFLNREVSKFQRFYVVFFRVLKRVKCRFPLQNNTLHAVV